MHIVGLLGMPRRVYTYPDGLGWTIYNVLETVGGFVTLAGILLLLGNLAVSYRRGAPAGPDPWHAPTLEWTTSSPPPAYNFAGHPEGHERVPELGRGRPREDRAQLERAARARRRPRAGRRRRPADADLADVVDVPHESPWPILLALTLSLVFAALVVGSFGVAACLALLCVLALLGWHGRAESAAERGAHAGARRRRSRPPGGAWRSCSPARARSSPR